MGPKAFITCYICFREFGTRSIPFHEPKCLERWRCSNRSLPPEKRSPTPVKPVGWKQNDDSTWLCPNCKVSVPSSKRRDHAATCFSDKGKATTLLIGKKITLSNMAVGATKSSPYSPKKGKENKNSMNNNSSNINATEKINSEIKNDSCKDNKNDSKRANGILDSKTTEQEQLISTSDKSVRPQTKILRRPTPNIKHPVIQVDSDESGDNSDKSKDENLKRLKHSSSSDCASDHKPKNFIMYNKYNVEKNTKNSPKERAAITDNSPAPIPAIPHPCNSCSRSLAPERLHSHSLKDARSLMMKKPASSEAKSPSLQKKLVQPKGQLTDSDNHNHDIPTKNNDNQEKVETPKVKKAVASLRSVCYICGKDPENKTLSSHEEKCLEKWKKQNGLLSPTRKRIIMKKTQPEPEPEPITETEPEPEPNLEPEPDSAVSNEVSQMDEMDPAWLAVQSQLVPCPSCSRTFFPERLPIHQRVCKGKGNTGLPLSRANSLRESSASLIDEDSGDKNTIYVPCYICKRSFGSWVIQMHESQCLRKWRRDNERLPEELQQPEPHKPQLVLDGESQPITDSSEDVAWESHLQQLVPCQRCGRTFFPDRLKVHGRSCKGKQQSTPRNSKISSNKST